MIAIKTKSKTKWKSQSEQSTKKEGRGQKGKANISSTINKLINWLLRIKRALLERTGGRRGGEGRRRRRRRRGRRIFIFFKGRLFTYSCSLFSPKVVCRFSFPHRFSFLEKPLGKDLKNYPTRNGGRRKEGGKEEEEEEREKELLWIHRIASFSFLIFFFWGFQRFKRQRWDGYEEKKGKRRERSRKAERGGKGNEKKKKKRKEKTKKAKAKAKAKAKQKTRERKAKDSMQEGKTKSGMETRPSHNLHNISRQGRRLHKHDRLVFSSHPSSLSSAVSLLPSGAEALLSPSFLDLQDAVKFPPLEQCGSSLPLESEPSLAASTPKFKKAEEIFAVFFLIFCILK